MTISSEEDNWLHSIIDIPGSSLGTTPGSLLGTTPHEESKHKISIRIPRRHVANEYYCKYYKPPMVSIGPRHYRESRVAPMENFKRKAVRELLLKSTLKNQDCPDELTSVLKVLAHAFKCEEFTFQLLIPPILDNYIDKVFLRHRRQPPDPVHLLQYYRDLWINVLFKDDVKDEEEDDDYQPFSVTDLKKVGIRCSCAISDHRKGVHLKSSMLSGKLFLPQLIINEWTMNLLYNLVAYEYSYILENTSFRISSYLNFMSMLINGEEDVKELRARGAIQINLKFSDDQVINFMRDITAHHEPNPQAFKDVKRQISTYCRSKNFVPLRVGYAEFKQNVL
ncbi:hypothetical protein RDI58_010343 [Solanum bulbocastanum]|uniref:Uncharacterized protein n=1 Tax=Solanum bulbocastanum TaxID=147425 RepID=A0AAN8YGA5_SOLBU